MSSAWKSDSVGPYVELDQGEKKDYEIDWSDYSGLTTLQNVTWVLPDGLNSLEEGVSGKVTRIVIEAEGAPGIYACQVSWNDVSGVPKEIWKFRVVIQ